MDTKSDASPEMHRSHASTGVIFRVDQDGLVYMVAFWAKDSYKGKDITSIKFPTEKSEKKHLKKETPWDTMLSGLQHEVEHPSCDPEDLVFRSLILDDAGCPQPLISVLFPSDDDTEDFHEKFVFLLEIVQGDEGFFRTVDKKEPDGDTVLGPPEFIEARELLKLMKERSPEYHRMSLLRALGRIAHDPNVFKKYKDILLDKENEHFMGTKETVQYHFWDRHLQRMQMRSRKRVVRWKPRRTNGH